MRSIFCILIFLFIAFFSTTKAQAQWLGDVEFNMLTTGYNRIQISGAEGTRFNLEDSFEDNASLAYRLRAGYRFGARHNVFVLFAPLNITYEGRFAQNTRFFGIDFLGDTPTVVDYRFNSYRLTYRYDFLVNDKIRLGAGLSFKVRDAYIEVEQSGQVSKKDNVGIVPLINLYLSFSLSQNFGLLLEGDGLASPQGRAFDFELVAFYNITDAIRLRAGYRILEGGADNDEVYNFTLINYGLVGLGYNF